MAFDTNLAFEERKLELGRRKEEASLA